MLPPERPAALGPAEMRPPGGAGSGGADDVTSPRMVPSRAPAAGDLDPRALLAATAEAAARLLGVADVWIWLYDAAEDVLQVGARVPHGPGDDLTVPVADSLVGRVLRSGRPLVTDEVSRDPLWARELPDRVRPTSGLFVPLVHQDRPLGVLVGISREEEPRFGDDDVRALRALGTHVAVAIQNAGLYQDARRQARQLATILDVNKHLALGPRLEEILSRITEGATQLLGASGASLWLIEDGTLALAATCGPSEPPMVDGRLPLNESLSGRVATENRPIIFTDLAGYPRAGPARPDPPHWPATRVSGLHSWLGVPLRGPERVLGALAVLSRGERRFAKADVGLLEAFADQAAVAIENARLFREAATAEALRELARLKTEFLSTASHELRTPLSLIHGYAELLMHRAAQLAPEQVAAMAGEIHGGSRTMVRLVDDLLDFSRLEQGRLRLRRRRVVVSETLGWLIDAFRRQPGGERIVAELAAEEAFVDPERLSQVVGNLLANALRYAPEGPILVRAARRNGWLEVDVSDRGPGIPPDEQGRIWDEFYRGSAALDSQERGNGLGLAVVKHLVELHGGRVGLSSGPGQGTTFRLTVPVEGPSEVP